MLERKILVLKPTCLDVSDKNSKFNGIVRIEKDDSVCSLHLSLVNAFASGGEYLCCIVDSLKKSMFYNLGARPSSFNKIIEPPPNLSRGFAVGVAIVKDYIPLTVAFSCPKELNFSLTDMNRLFADRCLSKRKQAQQTEKEPQKICIDDQKLAVYNDEAVATENYYVLDDNIPPCPDINVKEQTNINVSSEDDEPDYSCQKQTQKSQENDSTTKTKTSAFCCEESIDKHPFYLSVKRELDDLFEKFPAENSLNGHFDDCKFCKVYYSTEKYYIVGLVKECGEPKYICYGVPAKYSPEPPKELKGYCSFVPISIFNLFGDGFWMMFQSAEDGKCIKKI